MMAIFIRHKKKVNGQAIVDFSTLKLFNKNSLVVAMYGATIGKTGIVRMDFCTNQACCVLSRPIKNVDISYIQFIFQVMKPFLINKGYGGGQPNINAEIIRSLRIPIPSLPEQKKLSSWIIDKTTTCEKQILNAQKQILLLKEFQTRLNADVVTGKLDVREAARQLPDELDALLEDNEELIEDENESEEEMEEAVMEEE